MLIAAEQQALTSRTQVFLKLLQGRVKIPTGGKAREPAKAG
jgi:hypothetical protein